MQIPALDLKKQIAPIRKEIDAAIKSVIDHTGFILGKEVAEFEKEAAKYCNAKYAIGVSCGTDAIKLLLMALGIKPGDSVICPAFTYYATAGAIATIGAIPVFADIDPRTYHISASDIERAVKQKNGSRIKAVIPVHLYGQCADMDSILKISRKYNLKVVEDAAQAFGAEYKRRKSGTIGNCGAVSFFPSKSLGAFGDAGMVLTNNGAIADKVRLLRNQGNRKKYRHIALGCNNRLDTLQAAVLRVGLKYLDSWNNKRQEIAAYFNQHLEPLGIKTPYVPGYTTHIYHQYVIRLNRPSRELIRRLRIKGIDCRTYYPLPLHLQRCFKYLNYKKGDFPESEKASQQTLAIPIYPYLTKRQMNYIIDSIVQCLQNNDCIDCTDF